jgi:hypothetical protein
VPTLLTDNGVADLTDAQAVVRAGTMHVTPEVLPDAIGWELKPQGLCRGDVCIPTRSRPDLLVDGRIDLAVVADVTARPFVVEAAAGVAVLGESATARAEQLATRHVDDFELRDAFGNPFRWSSLGRKKKVLVAWASW